MVKIYTSLMLLTFLTGCNGWDVNVGGQKTAHSRVLASFHHIDADDEADLVDGMKFDLIRRQKNIVAEKKFYENGDFNASFSAGHHRRQRWVAGINLNYSF